jgi:HEAT repeat protein
MKNRIAVIVLAAFGAAGIVSAETLSPTEEAELARRIIQEGAQDKSPDVRIQAIVAASMIGNRESVVKQMIAFLKDKDVLVRITAIQTLKDIKSPDSVKPLENCLNDEVPEVAFAAAQALYVMNNPAGQQTLMDVFDKKAKANSNVVKQKSRSMFRNFYSVQSAAMFVAREGIGYVPLPGVGEGMAAMNELLGDPDLSPRAKVLLLLGRQQNESALDLLKRGLTDDDWSVRASAAQTISNTARKQLQNDLIPLFSDKKEKVRFRAAGAYLHLYFKSAS